MSSNDYPNPPTFSSGKDLINSIPKESTTPAPSPPVEQAPPQETLSVIENAVGQALVEEKPAASAPSPSIHETAQEEGSAHSEKEMSVVAEIEYSDSGAIELIKRTGYASVALWSMLTAAATGAATYFFAPGDYTWILGAVLGFMTGLIAAVDHKTHLIKNQYVIVTGVLTIPLAAVMAFMFGPWNFFFGILSSIIVLAVFIFLVVKVNFGSGGDIKYSPIPAFSLGIINPLVPVLWLFYAMIFTFVLLIIRKQTSTSFGEGMAISLPFAIASVCGLYALLGMPYLEPVM